MSADYERKLHRAVAQFVKEADKKYPNWSERNDNGEWEIGLDKFDDMYKVILEIIEYTSCDEATEQMLDDILFGMEVFDSDQLVLIVTENGYGKKTDVSEYRMTHRGSRGVKALNITEKNGSIVSFKTVTDDKDLIIITDTGMIIRLAVDKISRMSRVTQGVRLINLKDDTKVSGTAIVDKDDEEQIQENIDLKSE